MSRGGRAKLVLSWLAGRPISGMSMGVPIGASVGLAASALVCGVAQGQPVARAFVDDSIPASESLERVRELADAGNLAEASRVLQTALDEHAESLVAVPGDEDLFRTVRDAAHEILRANRALLDKYRSIEGPRAQELLDSGRAEEAERTRLLTRAGLSAATRLAQRELEAGRFESARVLIEPLEAHPDRAGDAGAARECAGVARMVAVCLAREGVSALSKRWEDDAARLGQPVDGERPFAGLKLASGVKGLSPLSAGPGLDVSSVPAKALQEVALPGDERQDDLIPGRRVPGDPRVMPVVSGELLLLNDSVRLAAFDRDTLGLVWEAVPELASSAPGSGDAADELAFYPTMRGSEDAPMVAVSDLPGPRVMVGVTGRALAGRRLGDPRVHGVEEGTGRVLWSVDIERLDKQLVGASVRGVPLIDADTVVLGARKPGTSGRPTTLSLVGLDLYTGSLRWVRKVGSIGRLPWGHAQRRLDHGVIDRGVVYRCDDMGVLGAFSAGTGRPLWVRRLSGRTAERTLRMVEAAPAYAAHVPVVDGDSLIVLEPGDGSIARVDMATGRVLARRDAAPFDNPRYILKAGNQLAAVGRSRITFADLASFHEGAIRLSPMFGDPAANQLGQPGAIQGRVVVAGSRLLVPLEKGLAIIDPAQPGIASSLELEAAGNVLSTGRHLLSADAKALRNFIQWNEARDLLQARIEASPRNVLSMLTFVELALRAREAGAAADMGEKAVALIDQATSENTAARRRLFDLLLVWINEHIAGGEDPKPVPAAQVDRLVRCLERTADGPEDRAAYLLASGALSESRGLASPAIDAYQEILADEGVGSALPARASAGEKRTAGELALLKLERIVSREGVGSYAAYADEAARAAEGLRSEASADELARLARRYPLAGVTPGVWERAAESFARAKNSDGSTRALGMAVRSAERLLGAGDTTQAQAVARLGPRLVDSLRAAGRPSAAYRVLRGLAERYPGLAIDARSRLAELKREVQASSGLARIGAGFRRSDPNAQAFGGPASVGVLRGWSIVEPLIAPGAGSPTDALILESPLSGSIALFVVAPGTSELEAAWTRAHEGNAPTALAVELDTTFLFWPGSKGGSVEAIDNATGRTLWRTDEFSQYFAENPIDPERKATGEAFATPLSGQVRAGDLVVSVDESRVMLVERRGRAIAIDRMSGKPSWTKSFPISRVFDIACAGKALVVAGAQETPQPTQQNPEFRPRLLAIDRATGESLATLDDGSGGPGLAPFGDHIRFLRATPGGSVLVGAADGMLLVDPTSGEVRFGPDRVRIRQPATAITSDDLAFVVDAERNLWRVDLAGGRTDRALDARERVEFPLRLSWVNDSVVLASIRGMAIFSKGGELLGVDPMDPEESIATPVLASGCVVAIQAEPAGPRGAVKGEEQAPATVLVMSSTTGKLVAREDIGLPDSPRSVVPLDGMLVITAGPVTLTLDAPPQ